MNAFLVKCKCQHCNQHLEFEAARAGENIPCPKCGMETLLFIPPSAAQLAQQKLNEPTYDAKNVGIIFSVIVLLSVLGFVEGGDLGSGHSAEHPIGLFQQRDRQAHLACRRRYFQPDVTRTDDYQLA